MAKIIKKHNKIVTSKVAPTSLKCNCHEKNTCPLNGNCQATSLIYQAKIKTATNPEKNIQGLQKGHGNKEATQTNYHSTTENTSTALHYQSIYAN